jgi:acyl-CoA synthetase (NDP forming)
VDVAQDAKQDSAERRGASATDLAWTEAFFRPSSIAVIGASDNPARVGGMPIRALTNIGYEGDVFPINTRRKAVQGRASYASIGAVPGPVDLAVVAVSSDDVLDVVSECVDRGVKGAVIFSSGFAEAGADGALRQTKLRDLSAASGIRICGPNCAGVMNVHAKVVASFGSHLAAYPVPRPGSISVISQSGAVGAYLYSLAHQRGVGMSQWITTGNEVDLDLGDFLGVVSHDEHTRVIALYIEQIRDADKFLAACVAAAARNVRLVAIVGGRSEASVGTLQSHTAAVAGDRRILMSVLEEAGVLLAHSMRELLDCAVALQERPPKLRTAGLVTVSGAAGILMTDESSARGIELPALSVESQARIRTVLPNVHTGNPIDVSGSLVNNPELLETALREITLTPDIGAVLCYMGHLTLSPDIAPIIVETLTNTARKTDVPLWLIGALEDTVAAERLQAVGVAVFRDPTEAVELLDVVTGGEHRLAAFARLLQRRTTSGQDSACADEKHPGRWLSEIESQRLLKDHGIPFPAQVVLSNTQQPTDLSLGDLKPPFAIKIISADIPHKAAVGGVDVGVVSEDVLESVAGVLCRVRSACPDAEIGGVVVQEIAEGTPVLVGARNDPTFGPVVVLGPGGSQVEESRSQAIGLAPLDLEAAHHLIRRSGISHSLDSPELAQLVVTVSHFAWSRRADVESVELNPVLVGPTAAVAVDALIQMEG